MRDLIFTERLAWHSICISNWGDAFAWICIPPTGRLWLSLSECLAITIIKSVSLFTTTAVSNFSNHKLISQEYLFKQFLKLLFLFCFYSHLWSLLLPPNQGDGESQWNYTENYPRLYKLALLTHCLFRFCNGTWRCRVHRLLCAF